MALLEVESIERFSVLVAFPLEHIKSFIVMLSVYTSYPLHTPTKTNYRARQPKLKATSSNLLNLSNQVPQSPNIKFSGDGAKFFNKALAWIALLGGLLMCPVIGASMMFPNGGGGGDNGATESTFGIYNDEGERTHEGDCDIFSKGDHNVHIGGGQEKRISKLREDGDHDLAARAKRDGRDPCARFLSKERGQPKTPNTASQGGEQVEVPEPAPPSTGNIRVNKTPDHPQQFVLDGKWYYVNRTGVIHEAVGLLGAMGPPVSGGHPNPEGLKKAAMKAR